MMGMEGDPFAAVAQEHREYGPIFTLMQREVLGYSLAHSGGPIYILLTATLFGQLLKELPNPPTPEVGGRISLKIEDETWPAKHLVADLVVVPDVNPWDFEGVHVLGDPGREYLRAKPWWRPA